MKLKKLNKNDPAERLVVSVRRSTYKLLEAYKAKYEKVYGEELEKSHLVEEIILNFIQSDKEFMKEMTPKEEKKNKKNKEEETPTSGN